MESAKRKVLSHLVRAIKLGTKKLGSVKIHHPISSPETPVLLKTVRQELSTPRAAVFLTG
jgi:hypothetical protein